MIIEATLQSLHARKKQLPPARMQRERFWKRLSQKSGMGSLWVYSGSRKNQVVLQLQFSGIVFVFSEPVTVNIV